MSSNKNGRIVILLALIMVFSVFVTACAGTSDKDVAVAGGHGSETQDEYMTDPVPDGKPKPVEPGEAEKTGEEHTCYLSVDCKTILDNMDKLKTGKEELVPEDGIIFPETEVTYTEGESVYDVLEREMRKAGIHMESSFTPLYNSHYIEGINNLYEFDCGKTSGWVYLIDGWLPNYGVSRYKVEPGVKIQFRYTCQYGDVKGKD